MALTAAHRKLLDAMLDKAPWPHRAGVYSIDEEEAEAIRALLQAYTMVSEERDRINDVLTKVYAERDELAERVKVLEDALRPFAEAHADSGEPIGDSDLDNEQPRSYHVELGAWRKAESVIAHYAVADLCQ